MAGVPLILEPVSRMYTSPVVVLDFQSLYPSIVIAYNLCYSTCLGRVPSETLLRRMAEGTVSAGELEKSLGVAKLSLPLGTLAQLQDHIWISPNGVMFLKPSLRPGLLPRLLKEILDTRYHTTAEI